MRLRYEFPGDAVFHHQPAEVGTFHSRSPVAVLWSMDVAPDNEIGVKAMAVFDRTAIGDLAFDEVAQRIGQESADGNFFPIDHADLVKMRRNDPVQAHRNSAELQGVSGDDIGGLCSGLGRQHQ